MTSGELFRQEREGLMGAPSKDGISIAPLGRAAVACALVLRMSRPVWNLGDGLEQLSYAATSFSGQ